MAVRLVRSILEGGVFILSLVGTFGYISTGEDSLWRPVSALLMATIVTTTLAISHTQSLRISDRLVSGALLES